MRIATKNLQYHHPHQLILDEETSTVPKNGSQTRTYTTEANFDTNMVIILAALLCALIFALGLNSIVRCALRCGRRIAFEATNETVARLASTGLKKKSLSKIPVAVYGSGTNNSHVTDCPICLGEFLEGEKVRVLPKCHHGFHVKCIDMWLFSHSSCPMCRQSLLELSPVDLEANALAGNGEHVPGIVEEVG